MNANGERVSEAFEAAYGLCKLGLVPILLGPPGIGKSEGVYQLATKLGCTNIVEIRLSQINALDLMGLPVVKDGITQWMRPEFLSTEPNTLYFFDELPNGSVSVQHAAYQILLDKKCGHWKLPAASYIIAAGNRKQDKCSVSELPAALRNRTVMIDMEADLDSWKSWAIPNGINPMVVGFLSFRPDLLFQFDPKTHERNFPTPRSWAMVSKVLEAHQPNSITGRIGIKGLVSEGTAIEFAAFCATYGRLPDIDAILAGKDVKIEASGEAKDAGLVYAIIAAITHKTCSILNDASDKNKVAMTKAADTLLNVIGWVVKSLPKEWVTLAMKDMMRHPNAGGLKPSMLANPKWKTVGPDFVKALSAIVGVV